MDEENERKCNENVKNIEMGRENKERMGKRKEIEAAERKIEKRWERKSEKREIEKRNGIGKGERTLMKEK